EFSADIERFERLFEAKLRDRFMDETSQIQPPPALRNCFAHAAAASASIAEVVAHMNSAKTLPAI
ncbi:hypothetical protein J4711_14265, partial [Staphylococcus epidermidis]|nr:hypothetical protein [Staphylococcus epidermidis]